MNCKKNGKVLSDRTSEAEIWDICFSSVSPGDSQKFGRLPNNLGWLAGIRPLTEEKTCNVVLAIMHMLLCICC